MCGAAQARPRNTEAMIIGTSKNSCAAKGALTAAAGSHRDLRAAEVVEQDITLNEDGEIDEFRTKLRVSFKHKKAKSWLASQ